MARAVASTFERGGILLAEAGTGTGKTLAYLVPAILSRQRVLVSTGTKNLQEQILKKDLPLLERALGIPFVATCMKGRGNYLCLHRFEAFVGEDTPGVHPDAGGAHSAGGRRGAARRGAIDQPAPDEGRRAVVPRRARGHAGPAVRTAATLDAHNRVHLTLIEEWARRTETGDRAEVDELPEDLPFWGEIAATTENCLGSQCPRFDECFVTRMRQRAAAADLVIVNHHLLCADAAVRQHTFGAVIPDCALAVIDEAHQLEDVATQYFGRAVSTYRIEELVRDGERAALGPAAPASAARAAVRAALHTLEEASRSFFTMVLRKRPGAPQARSAGDTGLFDERLRLTADALATLADAAGDVTAGLVALQAAVAGVEDASEDLRAIGRRAQEIGVDLEFLLAGGDEGFVYFLEVRGRGVFLRATPIDVSSIVGALLRERHRAAVLTSATLAVHGSFEYIRGRLGVPEAREVLLPSEFDYATQAVLYLPRRMPDPRAAEFPARAAEEIVAILSRTEGRAFVLFTSHAAMREAHARVAGRLPYPLLLQGEAPRTLLLERFRTTPNSVLLATSSFWQGVDVAGEALSCVIIDKLPFASPADPIVQARIESLMRAGEDAFGGYQVPLAILTLLQGLGRLLRHRSDRGVLAVLDPRLRTMGYGRRFLAALPPARLTHSLDDIERFFGCPD
jgi:ATP-dependent DNA helicase DinG